MILNNNCHAEVAVNTNALLLYYMLIQGGKKQNCELSSWKSRIMLWTVRTHLVSMAYRRGHAVTGLVGQ